jgi:hypothetical protein
VSQLYYVIDYRKRKVEILPAPPGVRNFNGFHHLEWCARRGKPFSSDPERHVLYSIARDQLMDEGHIKDVS